MRWLAILALALTSAAAAASASAITETRTSLTVTYWEGGRPSTDRVTWTLSCRPERGTLRRPGVACSHLAAGGWKLFAPLPEDIACTQIYGGPQVARVVGVVDGKRVWATFSRTDGCQIGRWNKLSPWLLPPGGITR